MPIALLTSSYKYPHATHNISMRMSQAWNETALMGEDKWKKMSSCFFSFTTFNVHTSAFQLHFIILCRGLVSFQCLYVHLGV